MTADPTAPTLGHPLAVHLLHQLIWLLAAAVVIAVLGAALAARAPQRVERARAVLLGAPDAGEAPGRRLLRVCFGVLWIVDGLLQAQPAMPAGFLGGVVDPAHLGGAVLAGRARRPARPGLDAAPGGRRRGHGVGPDRPRAAVAGRRPRAAGRARHAGGDRLESVRLGARRGVRRAVPDRRHVVGRRSRSGARATPSASACCSRRGGWWTAGRAGLLARRAVAAWLLLGAVLQAVPGEGAWTSDGAAGPFADGAAPGSRHCSRRRSTALAGVAARHPAAGQRSDGGPAGGRRRRPVVVRAARR